MHLKPRCSRVRLKARSALTFAMQRRRNKLSFVFFSARRETFCRVLRFLLLTCRFLLGVCGFESPANFFLSAIEIFRCPTSSAFRLPRREAPSACAAGASDSPSGVSGSPICTRARDNRRRKAKERCHTSPAENAGHSEICLATCISPSIVCSIPSTPCLRCMSPCGGAACN